MRTHILALAVFVAALFAAAPSPVFADETPPSPLEAALALKPEAFAQTPPARLSELAEWLTGWSILGPAAPVQGTKAEYIAALEKARLMYAEARRRDPENPESYWAQGETNYTLGELLPETDKTRREALYEEIVALTKTCLKKFPGDPGCNHFFATGMGRLATTHGVLSSMRSAADIERAWVRALAAKPTRVMVWSDPLLVNIEYGLGVYYRMAPDWWIMKVMLGTRGDKKKAVQLFRAAVEAQPYRLELEKEYAVALLCYADSEDDEKVMNEGKALMRRIIAGDFDKEDVRATDAVDKKHAAEMLADPAKACGYSRDGYQEIDRDKAEKMYENKQ